MLKTPTQIIQDNPGIKKYWLSTDIGYLLRMKLVRGKKMPGGRSGCMVEEKDCLKLFRNIIEG